MTFEPCENIVSRKIDEFEVKGKTAEVWIVKGKLQIRCLGVIHNIPLSLVTPQPCEDCISRQEAILQVQRYGVGCFDAEEFSPEQCERFVIQKLNELPPVAQKEKTGHWIFKNDNIAIPTGYYQCSECEEGKLLNEDNFCPNCGARMVSE